MIKHFCDWCGQEVSDNMGEKPEYGTVVFPILYRTFFNGKPLPNSESIFVEHKEYDICLDCIKKIWGLRKQNGTER